MTLDESLLAFSLSGHCSNIAVALELLRSGEEKFVQRGNKYLETGMKELSPYLQSEEFMQKVSKAESAKTVESFRRFAQIKDYSALSQEELDHYKQLFYSLSESFGRLAKETEQTYPF